MRILIVLLLSICFSGCVGLAVGSYGTFESQKDRFHLTEQRKKQGYGDKVTYTKKQVLSLWGEPDEISTNGSCDIFSYHDGYNWSGFGAIPAIVLAPAELLLSA
jgi:hypothetical protein